MPKKHPFNMITTAHFWYDSCFTSISVCGGWDVGVGVQIFKRKIYTHIRLDYARIEFLLYIYLYKIWLLFKYKVFVEWETRAWVQVSKKEFHIYTLRLNYNIISILYQKSQPI